MVGHEVNHKNSLRVAKVTNVFRFETISIQHKYIRYIKFTEEFGTMKRVKSKAGVSSHRRIICYGMKMKKANTNTHDVELSLACTHLSM